MADIDTAPKHDVTGEEGEGVLDLVAHFTANSTVKPNGIREVTRAGLDQAYLSFGVTAKEVKKVQEAHDAVTTAAADLAGHDLVKKIEESPKDQLKDDDYRRGLNSVVRLPTHGGKTEVQVSAEKVVNIPFRGEGEPKTDLRHGTIRTSVNVTQRVHKDLPGQVTDRIRNALGIKG